MVREKVEQTIDLMLDAEADGIANAARYERSGDGKAFRAGHYDRHLTAKAGGLSLKILKLKGEVFRSRVIERYRRREESVEEALMEMYMADVVHAPRGRHRPTSAGRADAPADVLRQAQESLRGHRRMARAPLGGRIPVRVRGRRVAQTLVGRARGERGRARRHRGRRRGTPRGDRGRRGHEGGRGQLGAVLQGDDRTRAERRAAGGGRPVRRSGGHRQLDAAEGGVPAVHGALHAQRALQDAARPPRMGVGGPEGRLRAGIARSVFVQ